MEMNFFTSFNNNYLGWKDKVQFIPFCCNIYALYQEMKKYDFDIDTEKGILLSPSISEEKKASIKDVKFESKYLVFDFDFQENSLSDETKIEALYEMIRFFNNDSENGLLLLNYPMFESFEERITSGDDFEEKKVLKNNLKCYKQSIQNRKLYLDCTKLKYDDFHLFIRNCLFLSNYIFHRSFESKLPFPEVVDEGFQKKNTRLPKENVRRRFLYLSNKHFIFAPHPLFW